MIATRDTSLLATARRSRERAEAMTHDELNAWYLEHVGYEPSKDDPTLGPLELTSMVASNMFYNDMPEGLDTFGAECMQGLMEKAIEQGLAL